MDRKLYKELWKIRFEKMLSLEKQSVVDYEALAKECRAVNPAHPVITHLERLVLDEKRHARLVEELLDILSRQSV